MNAVKHGMYSAAVVLPGESQEEYDALLARYLDRFRPASPDAEHLVHTLVNAEWRIKRLIHIQTARLADIIRRQSNEGRDPIANAYTFDLIQTQTIATADKHEARLQREYDRALRRLLDIEKRGASAPRKNARNELDQAPAAEPLSAALACSETSETNNVPAACAARAPARDAKPVAPLSTERIETAIPERRLRAHAPEPARSEGRSPDARICGS
jgi:hypothetical protein